MLNVRQQLWQQREIEVFKADLQKRIEIRKSLTKFLQRRLRFIRRNPILPETEITRCLDFRADKNSHLEVGEKLRLSIEVDGSFADNEYVVSWTIESRSDWHRKGKEVMLEITTADLSHPIALH